MPNKYLQVNNTNGGFREVEAIDTSSGAGDAGKIIGLDSAGKLSSTMLPAGVGATTISVPASENLAAGDFVNLWNDSGTLKARKADATSASKSAYGFVLASVTSPSNALVYALSESNNALTGLTVGSGYFLSATAGQVTTTAPTASNNIRQFLGVAVTTTTILTRPEPPVLLV